jgi:hypothetical protein
MGYRARQFKRHSPLRGLLVLVIAGLIAARLVTLALPHLRDALRGTILGDGSKVPSTICRAGNPLAGVYNPGRLAVRANCVSAIGRVVFILHAPDGDLHISLLPDRGYWRLLDRSNYTKQGATLVVEIVPADQATVHAPAIGAHVQVTGTYVTDLEHGWREIHPVWRITPV